MEETRMKSGKKEQQQAKNKHDKKQYQHSENHQNRKYTHKLTTNKKFLENKWNRVMREIRGTKLKNIGNEREGNKME